MSKQIKQYDEKTAPVAGDLYLLQEGTTDTYKKVDASNIVPDGTITPEKLGLGETSASVSTAQTTTSTSYTDLATAGPAVTLTIGNSGRALVITNCVQEQTTSGSNFMSFAVSGATSTAASDTNASRSSATAFIPGSRVTLVTGLTPGSTTFTAKYRVTANTGGFRERSIVVIPL